MTTLGTLFWIIFSVIVPSLSPTFIKRELHIYSIFLRMQAVALGLVEKH
jgi:hypothetical protein